MPTPFQLVLGVAALVGLGVLFLFGRRLASAFVAYRGTRVVVCPENREMVAVAVDAGHAALSASQGHPDLRLESCTRWPEKAGCGQECLGQIEHAPEACLLTHILGDWYQGKSCAFCGKGFPSIHWHDHKPALLAPGGAIVEWSAFAPEQIVDVLVSHKPVCWDCAVAERFRSSPPCGRRASPGMGCATTRRVIVHARLHETPATACCSITRAAPSLASPDWPKWPVRRIPIRRSSIPQEPLLRRRLPPRVAALAAGRHPSPPEDPADSDRRAARAP